MVVLVELLVRENHRHDAGVISYMYALSVFHRLAKAQSHERDHHTIEASTENHPVEHQSRKAVFFREEALGQTHCCKTTTAVMVVVARGVLVKCRLAREYM